MIDMNPKFHKLIQIRVNSLREKIGNLKQSRMMLLCQISLKRTEGKRRVSFQKSRNKNSKTRSNNHIKIISKTHKTQINGIRNQIMWLRKSKVKMTNKTSLLSRSPNNHKKNKIHSNLNMLSLILILRLIEVDRKKKTMMKNSLTKVSIEDKKSKIIIMNK